MCRCLLSKRPFIDKFGSVLILYSFMGNILKMLALKVRGNWKSLKFIVYYQVCSTREGWRKSEHQSLVIHVRPVIILEPVNNLKLLIIFEQVDLLNLWIVWLWERIAVTFLILHLLNFSYLQKNWASSKIMLIIISGLLNINITYV